MPAHPYLSQRKRAVIEAVEAIGRPFTSVQLWEFAGLFHEGISQANVYRILRKLRADGFIKDVILPHGLRVSIRTESEAYCILECEDCGRFKMCLAVAKQIETAVSGSDLLPLQSAVYIRGRCREKLATDRCEYSSGLSRAEVTRSRTILRTVFPHKKGRPSIGPPAA